MLIYGLVFWFIGGGGLKVKMVYVFSVIFIFIIVTLSWRFGFLDYALERFYQRQGVSQSLTLDSIISGESINRKYVFNIAYNRLTANSWIVGYGWGVPESNAYAWFGEQNSAWKGGLHSLYLSLPMIYGWGGSVAFVALLLYLAVKAWSHYFTNRAPNNSLVSLLLGLAVFYFIFIIDQYKINILRTPNYHMMIWIWMGITVSVINSLKLYSKK